MLTAWRIAAVVATIGATVLTWAFHSASLVAAGPYKTMLVVQVGAAIGTYMAYLLVLLAIGWLSFKVQGIQSRWLRGFTLAVVLLVSFLAMWLAPGVSFLVLAAVCQVPVACPAAANPIGWAYLQLAPPRGTPFSTAWLALLAFLLPVLMHMRQKRSSNDAPQESPPK